MKLGIVRAHELTAEDGARLDGLWKNRLDTLPWGEAEEADFQLRKFAQYAAPFLVGDA